MPFNTITTWQQAVVLATINVLDKILAFLPNLIGALIIFLIGSIIANWAKALVIRLLHGINLSTLVKDTSVEKFLKKAEISAKIELLVGQSVKWLILLIAFIAAVNVLGLTEVSRVLNNILNYIPRVISAMLVLALGVLVAGFIESLIKGGLGSIDIKVARLLGKIGSYAVVIFAALAALAELRIAQELINIFFTGLVAMLALGFGLALGLGSKDLIAQILSDWYQQFRKDTR